MSGLALCLILISALFHATWNYISKKVCGGPIFIWMFSGIATLIYLPFMLYTLVSSKIDWGLPSLLIILCSACLHLTYFILLDKGYKIGDLSVIYPLARGTGPLLSLVIAVSFLKERPTLLAICGALFIVIGTVIIAGNSFTLSGPNSRNSILYALLCGVSIASYTISDKLAVSTLMIPPLLMDWCTNFGRFLLLTPYASNKRNQVKELWTRHKRETTAVAVLSPLAYILVLTAMVFSPVSYIAPAREISILIGTIMGVKLLSEGSMRIRLAGAAMMVAGLAALSL
jgi:drug/metabolite transporter (DMT)-like permease